MEGFYTQGEMVFYTVRLFPLSKYGLPRERFQGTQMLDVNEKKTKLNCQLFVFGSGSNKIHSVLFELSYGSTRGRDVVPFFLFPELRRDVSEKVSHRRPRSTGQLPPFLGPVRPSLLRGSHTLTGYNVP